MFLKKMKTRVVRNGWLFFLKKKKKTRVVRNALLVVFEDENEGVEKWVVVVFFKEEEEEENKGAEKWVVVF